MRNVYKLQTWVWNVAIRRVVVSCCGFELNFQASFEALESAPCLLVVGEQNL